MAPAAAVIRPAVPADRDAIIAIHCASWRDSYRGILPDEDLGDRLTQKHSALWTRIFAEPVPGRVVLVAAFEERVTGFVVSHPDRDGPGVDFIAALHVDPKARGGGLGSLLMRDWSDRLAAVGRRRAVLVVAEANGGARAFYRRLGGVEGPVFEDDLGGHGSVPALRVAWENLGDIGTRARAELLRRLDPPLSVRSADVAAVTDRESGADHPVAAGQQARARQKQRLGDAFGLSDFGVNRVTLNPGVWSSIPHFHSREDEFVYVVEGSLTLVSGGESRVLGPGDCAGFPAGLDRPHHLENRSDVAAVYLEIGSRRPDADECDYVGEDLRVVQFPDGRRGYARRDGSEVPGQ